jgi:hypothetical protein
MTQVKSRQRVADHGEVFTAEREVKAMLDLVANEVMRIASRFLEPACGDGNFLAEVLYRKLSAAEAQCAYKRTEYERITFLAISTLYGIDLLSDNVLACRERLFRIFDKQYTRLFGSQSNDRYRNAIQYVIEKNIILGNTLKAQTILLTEWILGKGDMVEYKEYSLASLMGPSSIDLFAGLENRGYSTVHLLDLRRRK